MSRNTPKRVSSDLKTLGLFESADENSRSLNFIRLMLRSFLEVVQAPDSRSAEEFSRIMGLASEFRLLGMSQKELACHLLTTPSTLQRWFASSNLPVPIARKAYLSELAVLIEKQLDTLPSMTERVNNPAMDNNVTENVIQIRIPKNITPQNIHNELIADALAE